MAQSREQGRTVSDQANPLALIAALVSTLLTAGFILAAATFSSFV